jgi:predicted XRE-type DNA-binding protein
MSKRKLKVVEHTTRDIDNPPLDEATLARMRPACEVVPEIRSSGNVFKDIGLPDADEHAIKADIVIKLAKLIEIKGLSQSKAASLTGIAQPDLSKLLRGHFSGFSMDRLVQTILALGLDVEIRVKKPVANRRGRAYPCARRRSSSRRSQSRHGSGIHP